MSSDDAPGYGALPAGHEESLDPERARQEARLAVEAAIVRMARAAGAEVRERPSGPGVASTVRDAAPAAGIELAVILADAARRKIYGYIRQARQDGQAWQQIGGALRLGPVADEHGLSVAEAAFDYATDAEHARPFATLSFAWTCLACGKLVTDYGPAGGHPDDCESGHAEGCKRHAADLAAYEAQWVDQE